MLQRRARPAAGSVVEKLAFISLGSNVGDRVGNLREALTHLALLSEAPLLISSFWETNPIDCPPDSPPFINLVTGIWPLPGEAPESLLLKLQEIEKTLGRPPKKMLNEPRVIDLDLLAFASETRATPSLILPHPRAHLRRFVLEPWAEIAPELVFPGQTLTVAQLLATANQSDQIRRILPSI